MKEECGDTVRHISDIMSLLKNQGFKVDEESFLLGYYTALGHSEWLLGDLEFFSKLIEHTGFRDIVDVKKRIVKTDITCIRKRLREILDCAHRPIPQWLEKVGDWG